MTNLQQSIIVRYVTYTNTRAELSLEEGRVVSEWGRVVLGRVVGGPNYLPTSNVVIKPMVVVIFIVVGITGVIVYVGVRLGFF